MTRKALALFLASGLTLSCGDDGMSPPSRPAPAGTFAVLSTSPTAGGTVPLPIGFFDFPEGNGWVQDLTVTIRFTFSEPISDAIVFIVLWRGSEQCLVAEGLVLGAPYGGRFNYVAGSTITQSGNSFTGASQCRAGAPAGARASRQTAFSSSSWMRTGRPTTGSSSLRTWPWAGASSSAGRQPGPRPMPARRIRSSAALIILAGARKLQRHRRV